MKDLQQQLQKLSTATISSQGLQHFSQDIHSAQTAVAELQAKLKSATNETGGLDLSKFSNFDFEKATDEEKKQQDVMGESTTFFKDGMKRLRKDQES